MSHTIFFAIAGTNGVLEPVTDGPMPAVGDSVTVDDVRGTVVFRHIAYRTRDFDALVTAVIDPDDRERFPRSTSTGRGHFYDPADAQPPAPPQQPASPDTEQRIARLNKRIWFTTRQAAEYAACNQQTVSKACRTGTLKAGQPSGGRNGKWRIHRDGLDAWIRGGHV